jgi:hypothetical protein
MTCLVGDCRSQNGRAAYTDGSVYEGEWKDGQHHGQGKAVYPSGNVYVGQWKVGQKQDWRMAVGRRTAHSLTSHCHCCEAPLTLSHPSCLPRKGGSVDGRS